MARHLRPVLKLQGERDNVRCWARYLFISNMVTLLRPPNTAWRLVSAMISRLFCGFWSLCFLMYSQTRRTTSGRERGAEPTMAASSAEGCKGFVKAEFDAVAAPVGFDFSAMTILHA